MCEFKTNHLWELHFLTWGMDAATTKVQWLAKPPSEVTPLAKLWFQIWCIERLPCVLVMGLPVVSRIYTLSNLQAAAFLNNALVAIIMTAYYRRRKRTVHLIWNSWWHHCWLLQVQHACVVAAQAKQVGELRLNSPPRWRELPKPHVLDLFYIDSLPIRSFTIISSMGTPMEEGFEPAKEEAVRIFLEGGVPTSCWELRNRHLKTLWDRVSGVHEVHMGNTWSITGLFLVNGLLGSDFVKRSLR